MPYFPGKPPPTTSDDGTALAFYLEDELSRLAASLLDDVQAVEIRPAHSVPIRPRIGMLVYADGVDWNPGFGEGLYEYQADAAWHKVVVTNNAAFVSEGIELGSPSVVGTPFIDFHSSGNVIDYDCRIVATGGSASLGFGSLNFYNRFLVINYTDGSVGANLVLAGPGATTPAKYIRSMGGNLEFIDNAYSNILATLTDGGELSWVGAAWTSYTPTVTITGGAGTATGFYKKVGKTLFVKATITGTVNGTSLSWTLPPGMTFANGSQYVFGREQASNGFVWSGRGDGAGNIVNCQRYDNNTTMTAGFVVVFTGVVEVT